MWIQFFRPRATGRMEFSARLLLSSSSGYSRNRVSFLQSVSAYWQALLSALEGNTTDALPRSCCEYHREEALLFPDAEHGAPHGLALYGELPRQPQTVRPSAPQSELQPEDVRRAPGQVPEVKSDSRYVRFVIAKHSPERVLETGLPMEAMEKNRCNGSDTA